MPDNKLTDNEIVKIDIEKYAEALNNLIGVDSAYFRGDKDVDAIVEIITIAKKQENLINRLQAENERLRKENEILSENADTAFQDGLNENQALFEKTVLKDFVKELKEKADELKQIRLDGKWAISQYDVDKLLKEKVGDKK